MVQSLTVNKRIYFRWKQHLAAFLTVVYIAEQLFLPYSHFITKVRDCVYIAKALHIVLFKCYCIVFQFL